MQKLFSEVQLIQSSGYQLSSEDTEKIKSLSSRILVVLPSEKFVFFQKAFNSIMQKIECMRSLENSPQSSSVITKATWIGVLIKEGREEEAVEAVLKLEDPKTKALGYGEFSKAGRIDFVLNRLGTMSKDEVNYLQQSLNEDSKNLDVQTALILLPGCLFHETGRPEEGMQFIEKIEDPKLKVKAYVQLAKDGGLPQIIEHSRGLPSKEGKSLLWSVREEFFANSEINETLLKEWMGSVDVGLEELQAKEAISLKVPTESSPVIDIQEKNKSVNSTLYNSLTSQKQSETRRNKN